MTREVRVTRAQQMAAELLVEKARERGEEPDPEMVAVAQAKEEPVTREMQGFDDAEPRSWAELAEEFEAHGQEIVAARMRYLIPRLGDMHGPPQVGMVISGDVVRRCSTGTILRATESAAVAIRTVSGWQVSGMASLTSGATAPGAEAFVRMTTWRVVEVPSRDAETP